MLTKTIAAKKSPAKATPVKRPLPKAASAKAAVPKKTPRREALAVPMTCRFFLADDIRQELHGKVTAVGLYSDNVVLVELPGGGPDPSLAKPAAIASLAILASVSTPAGPHLFNVQLRDAKGAMPFGPFPPRSVISTKDAPASNIILRFQPLPFATFGLMHLTLQVDDASFEFTFEIRRRPVASPNSGPQE